MAASRVMPAAADPTISHLKGLKPNCEILTSTAMRATVNLTGVKSMVTLVVPFAGTMPDVGEMEKSGWYSTTSSSYSNCMGTLHSNVTRRVAVSDSGQMPKSMRVGNTTSFITGYAWMGISRFSFSLCSRTQS